MSVLNSCEPFPPSCLLDFRAPPWPVRATGLQYSINKNNEATLRFLQHSAPEYLPSHLTYAKWSTSFVFCMFCAHVSGSAPQWQPLSNVMGRLDNCCEAKILGHWSRPSFSQRAACMALLRLVSQGSGDKNACVMATMCSSRLFFSLSPCPPFPGGAGQPTRHR